MSEALLLLESWWPAICNFIEENDLKVSLQMLVFEISLGTWLNSHSPLWRRKNSDWASDRLTSRVSLWKGQVGGLTVLSPCQVARPHRAFFPVQARCCPRLPQACGHSLLLPEESLPPDSADLKDPPSSIGATQPAIYLSLEGLIGRAPSTDFPQTMKLWNGIPEWLWVTAIWSQQLIPFLVKKRSVPRVLY